MIEALEGARQAPAHATTVNQRAGSHVSTPLVSLFDGWNELAGSRYHHFDLLFSYRNVIQFGHLERGRAGNYQPALRQNDIAIRRLIQAVDHALHQALVESHHHPGGGTDGNPGSGQAGDFSYPGAGGVDGQVSGQLLVGILRPGPHLNSNNISPSIKDETFQFGIS